MNKFIVALFIMLVSSVSFAVDAGEKTYYYKQTKVVKNGVSSTQVGGGQFITFIGDICFESTKYGVAVGHGNMDLQRELSTSSIKRYSGGCYYGTDAIYAFSSDLSVLNITTKDDVVYVYKRSTPPSGINTCSLIRKRKKKDSSPVQHSVTTSTPQYFPNLITPAIIPAQSVSSSTQTQNTKGHQCPLCKGKGRKIVENYWGQSGDQTKWCDECYQRVGIGHTHHKCDLCGGDGWIEGY